MITVQAVLVGMVVMLAGSIPRNLLFAANLRFHPELPWAVPLVIGYLWLFWRYLNGAGPPTATREERRASLRARPLPAGMWCWALLAGGLGLVALVLVLRLANRLVVLPEQTLPDLGLASAPTVVGLLLLAAPVAGIVEEAAFRGYMQRPIERRHGLPLALLVTGTMFAVAHLDFTLILWPYYVAVAVVYGTVVYLTDSILPAVVLHTGGNLYSNFDLWLRGRAEWQAPSGPTALVWATGADRSFWMTGAAFLAVTLAAVGAYLGLARAAQRAWLPGGR